LNTAWVIAIAVAVALGVFEGLQEAREPRHLGWWVAGFSLVAGLVWGVRAIGLPLVGCFAAGLVGFLADHQPPTGAGGIEDAPDVQRAAAYLALSLVVGLIVGAPALLGALLRWGRLATNSDELRGP
jgi:hypothetical protein